MRELDHFAGLQAHDYEYIENARSMATITIKRDSHGHYLPGTVANPGGRPNTRWRIELRKQIGSAVWDFLVSVVKGEPYEPKMPDGRAGPVQVPSFQDRQEAARTLLAYSHGKPVEETEIARAEASQAAFSAVPEADLKRLINAQNETEAELVPVAGVLPATVESKK